MTRRLRTALSTQPPEDKEYSEGEDDDDDEIPLSLFRFQDFLELPNDARESCPHIRHAIVLATDTRLNLYPQQLLTGLNAAYKLYQPGLTTPALNVCYH